MADEVDRANDLNEAFNRAVLEQHNGDMPQGEPGECAECGYYFERLVYGLCARCRDDLHAPRH